MSELLEKLRFAWKYIGAFRTAIIAGCTLMTKASDILPDRMREWLFKFIPDWGWQAWLIAALLCLIAFLIEESYYKNKENEAKQNGFTEKAKRGKLLPYFAIVSILGFAVIPKLFSYLHKDAESGIQGSIDKEPKTSIMDKSLPKNIAPIPAQHVPDPYHPASSLVLNNSGGKNNSQVGAVSQGPGSTFSMGQQGGITAGQLVTPALNPNDPYPTNSDQQVVEWTLAEVDKIEQRARICMSDLQATSRGESPELNIDATPEATRSHFYFFILDEKPTIQKLHDSLLARNPSLRNQEMEENYDYDIQPHIACWVVGSNPSVTGYLRQMATELSAHKPPKR